jgi:transcriptional regulator with XRE-family HTH domain
MTFAERLRQLRKKKGLSQNELSEAMGVHFTQVSRYERGETKPNAEAIAKLAHALDTTVDYLMSGTSDDAVVNAGLDKEIVSKFKLIQELTTEDKKTVLSLLDAYIAKQRIERFYKIQSV